MANSIKTQIKQNLQQAKVQSGTRISRIREIIRDAASQTASEVKQGSGEIQGIAKGTFSTVVGTLADGQTEADVSESPSPTLRQLITKAVAGLKTKAFTQFKHRAVKLDDELTARYGSDYQTGKQRLGQGLEQTAARYRQAVIAAKEQGSVPLQQKQVEIQEKASLAGAAAARREQQIKQYLKSVFKTTAAKL